jgi:NADH-quinone oxidoreductase subunit E
MDHNKLISRPQFIRTGIPVAFTPGVLKKVQELMKRYPEGQQKSALLPVLHIAQEELGGYLSVDIMDYVAALLGIQPVEVYEVATFYSMFYLDKMGKYVIEVCRTGPCAISGGEQVLAHLQDTLEIHPGETTADGLFTLKEVECLGSCGTGPVMQVNSVYYEKLTPGRVDRILEDMREFATKSKADDSSWVENFC